MSTLVKAWCSCGWHGEYDTQARADYARRKHSCEKHEAARERARRRAEWERTTRIATACRHHGRHKHGTSAMYVLDECRCRPCTDARRVDENARNRAAAYGRPALVDARPAAAHVRQLMAAGLGWKRVAELSGIPNGSVYALLYGRPDRNGGQPRTKARQATVDALLAVPFPTLDHFPDHRLVPALGPRRRVQALQTIGWSVNKVCEHAGLDRQAVDKLLRGGEQTLARTARAIRDVYDQLWNVAPPAGDQRDRIAKARSQRRASEAGWAPPMAWDDDALDQPDAEPAPGWRDGECSEPGCPGPVLARGLCSDHYHRARRGGPGPARLDLDEWADLVRAGEHPDRAAERCGVRLETVRTAAVRQERRDVLDLITSHRDARKAA